MTILLLDDNKELLFLLGQSLRKKGFEVHTALNGTAALVILSENKIDLVISDVIMFGTPIMSFTCTLKNLYPKIPLLLISGDPKNSLIDNAFTLGANEFIPKPINISELVAAINKLTVLS